MAWHYKVRVIFGVLLILAQIGIRMVSPRISGKIADDVITSMDMRVISIVMR